MSNERSLVFTGGLALQTAPGMARLVSPDHEDIDIPEPTLGMLAEWLAVAWVNVTGKEYEHREVGVRVDTKEFTDVLVKEGVVYAGEHVIPKRHMTDAEFNKGLDALSDFAKIATKRAERDCE